MSSLYTKFITGAFIRAGCGGTTGASGEADERLHSVEHAEVVGALPLLTNPNPKPSLADLVVDEACSHQRRRQREATAAAASKNCTVLAAMLQHNLQAQQTWPTPPIPSSAIIEERTCQHVWPVQTVRRSCWQPTAHARPSGSAAPSWPCPRPAAPLVLSKQLSQDHFEDGSRVYLRSWTIPSSAGVPPFKAWCHVLRNKPSLEVGQRMFYTDQDTGETFPVSDDDDNVEDETAVEADERHAQALLGLHRERFDRIISEVTSRLGAGAEVVAALAGALEVSSKAVAQRAQTLASKAQQCDETWVAQARGSMWAAKVQRREVESDLYSTYCRICRTYGCWVHALPYPRPVIGPLRPGEVGLTKRAGQARGHDASADVGTRDAGCESCGPLCFRAGVEWSTCVGQSRQGTLLCAGRSPFQAAQPAALASGVGPLHGEAGSMEAPMQSAYPLDPGDLSDMHESGGLDCSAATNAAASAAAAPSLQQKLQTVNVAPAIGVNTVACEYGTVKGVTGNMRPWEGWEDAVVQRGIGLFGRQPCKLARLVIGRACHEVHSRLETLWPEVASSEALDVEESLGCKRRRFAVRKVAPPQKRSTPAVAYKRHKRSRQAMWAQYSPCACPGACKESCPCRGDTNFCEKFCGCDPARCGNRFKGCMCKCGALPGKRCSSRQCPCMAAGRECDPDLCKDCKPTLSDTQLPGWQCNNFRLRLTQKKRVMMGRSKVQGWGAFVQDGASKDDFLGEYSGHLIEHTEADRRGKVYDRDDNSYLFNLNLRWVLDARFKGNKLRFANHSSMANCRAEILVVDGDHRVGVLSNQPLEPGDELFYDYHYDHRVAPDWAQRTAHSAAWPGGGGSAEAKPDKGRGLNISGRVRDQTGVCHPLT